MSFFGSRNLFTRTGKWKITGTFIVLFFAIGCPSQSHTLDAREEADLRSFEPHEKLIQRCDIESMSKLRADKVIGYTFSPLKQEGNRLEASGAAYRKHGHWYHLSYSCTLSKDRERTLTFSYHVGNEIPRRDWSRYWLF